MVVVRRTTVELPTSRPSKRPSSELKQALGPVLGLPFADNVSWQTPTSENLNERDAKQNVDVWQLNEART